MSEVAASVDKPKSPKPSKTVNLYNGHKYPIVDNKGRRIEASAQGMFDEDDYNKFIKPLENMRRHITLAN